MGSKRITKLDIFFSKYNPDVIFITNLINIRYLSKFTGSSANLLIFNPQKFSSTKPIFITDGRYTLQAKEQVMGFDILISQDMIKDVLEICNNKNISSLGFEAVDLSYSKFLKLEKNLSSKLIPITDNLNKIRYKKDDTEIDHIKNSIEIATKSFNDIKNLIEEKITELELKRELEYSMVKNGAIKPSFDSITVFGAKTALPHASPGLCRLEKESLVLIDYGALSNSYASDETITLYYGKNPPKKIIEIYDLVHKAHDEAIKQIKPGMKACDADLIARKIISAGGYEKEFSHSLGHSVGLETHDGFALSFLSNEVIDEGMILTIEPGIYIEGLGGVRLEDIILITSSGAEVLTKLPKDLKSNIIS